MVKNAKVLTGLGLCAVIIAVGAFSYFGNGAYQGNLNRLQRAPVEFFQDRLSRALVNGTSKIYGMKITTDANGALPRKLTFAFSANVDVADAIGGFSIQNKEGQVQPATITNSAEADVTNPATDITGNLTTVNEKIIVQFLPAAAANLRPNTAYIYYLNTTMSGASASNKITTQLVAANGNDLALRMWEILF